MNHGGYCIFIVSLLSIVILMNMYNFIHQVYFKWYVILYYCVVVLSLV